jgi:hypothetical protein
MVEIVVVVISATLLLFIGITQCVAERSKLNKDGSFVYDFNNAFVEYFQSMGRNIVKYQFLIMNSNRMQLLLGEQGLMHMRPPFTNLIIKDYPIVVNGIPEMQKYFMMGYFDQQANQMGQYVLEALLRTIGQIRERKSRTKKYLMNPVKLIVIGIHAVLSAPIYMLSSLNIIGKNSQIRFLSSDFYRIIKASVTFISFTSSVFSIIFRWDEIVQFMYHLFQH